MMERRELVMIEGSLRNVPLSDVFQIIATGMKSGVLTVNDVDKRARIYFEMGRIQYAHLTPGVHLGEILVRMELLTSYEVQDILRKQVEENPGTPLGLTATDMGYVTQEELKRALESQITEVLTDIMLWRRGNFHFAEKSPMASQVPTDHTFDGMGLLMEVIRRIDEWKVGQVAPEDIFERCGDPTKITMPEGGWEVLGHINGRRSAASVSAELDLSEKHVYHLLFELQELGIIRPTGFTIDEPLILVVCYSSAFQRLIRLSLQRAGLRPRLAETFREGFAILQKEHPQAIIVDALEGEEWDFVREIRKLPGRSHLPIVVLTREVQPQGFFDRFRRPKAQILQKPFEESAFQQLIMQLVGKSLA
jgi:CheY-like chemotaxis protein